MPRRGWWYRSSPWIGLLGGLLVATSYQLGIEQPTDWFESVFLGPLFGISPVVGFLALGLVGFLLGWVNRWFEDRFIYAD